ncbi:hypothetical protein [Saccharopolyspora sp. CA-218241]|uniref:hypothetical protein n=1 Tax=Saccharopolyspora sp. CA-218241 TaxID=3240027 RepID=UPI003D9724A8
MRGLPGGGGAPGAAHQGRTAPHPAATAPRPRPAPPRWPVVCGGLAVAALVVTAVAHAACSW